MSSRRLPPFSSEKPSGQFERRDSRDSSAPYESQPVGPNVSDGEGSSQFPSNSTHNEHNQRAFQSNESSHFRRYAPGNERSEERGNEWSEESSGYNEYGSKGRGDTFQCSDPTVTSPDPPGGADMKTDGSDRRSRKSPFKIDPTVYSPNVSHRYSSEENDDGFYGGRGASFVPDESLDPEKERSSGESMIHSPHLPSDQIPKSPASQRSNLRSDRSEGKNIGFPSPTGRSDIRSQQLSEERSSYGDKGRASTHSRSNPNLTHQAGSWKDSPSRSHIHPSTHSNENVAQGSSSTPSVANIPHTSQSGTSSTKSFKLTDWEKSSMYSPFFKHTAVSKDDTDGKSTEKIDDGKERVSPNEPSSSAIGRSPTERQGLSPAKQRSPAVKFQSESSSNPPLHTATFGDVYSDAVSATVPVEGVKHTEGGTPKTPNDVPSASDQALKSSKGTTSNSSKKKVLGPRNENSDPIGCHFDAKTRILKAPIVDPLKKRTAEVGLLDKECASPPDVPFVGFYTTPTPSLSPMPIVVVHDSMYRLMDEKQRSMPIPLDFEFTLFPFLETDGKLLRGPYGYCNKEQLIRFIKQVESKRVIKTEFVTNGSDLSCRRNYQEETRSRQLEKPIQDTPFGKRSVPDGKKDNIAGIQYPQVPTVGAKEAKGRYEFAMRPEKPVTVKSFLDKEVYSKDPIEPLDFNQSIGEELPNESHPCKPASTTKQKGRKNSDLLKSFDCTQKDTSGQLTESKSTHRSRFQQDTACDSTQKTPTVQETKSIIQSAVKTPPLTTSSTQSGTPNKVLGLVRKAKAMLLKRSSSEDRDSRPAEAQSHRSRCPQPKATTSSSNRKVTFDLAKPRRRPSSIHARDDNDPAQKLFNKLLAEYRVQNPKKPPKVYPMKKDTGPLGMPSFHEPSNDIPSEVITAEPQFAVVDRLEHEMEYGTSPVFANVFPQSTYAEDKEKLREYFTRENSAQTGLSLLGLVDSPKQKASRSVLNIRKTIYKKYLGEEKTKRNSKVNYEKEEGYQRNIQFFVQEHPFRPDDSEQMIKRVGQAVKFLNKKEYIPNFVPTYLWNWWKDAILKKNKVAIHDAMYFFARADKLGNSPKYLNEWRSFLSKIFPSFTPEK